MLVSVNVGLPKDVPWQGRTVYTGVWKHPVPGPVMVRRLNIDGDGQGDLAGHGGEQRAVLVYQIESYRYWQRYFGRDDFTWGQFGENLTVDGLPDDEVCIGDRYRIGQAEFEVTQPRVTCYRVGLRLGEHPFAAEAHDLLACLPHAREHVFYSKATSSERRRGYAAAGRLTKEALAGLGLPAGASAYICGPASFMTDMRDALTAIGLHPARIHTELFGALASINPGLTGRIRPPPHQPLGPPGTGPLVTFARSGIAVPFGNRGQSVLDLADACDVPTRWSCRTGVCRTCITPLLSGDIAYAPEPLERPADGQVLICCARPATEIVLDM